MAAKDVFHDTVRNALGKDGWTITHDMFHIKIEDGTEVVIDLAAERVIIAEKDAEKIAVEIKSFLSLSPFYEFHAALGQFLNYREVLDEYEPQRLLFLAVPLETYTTLFRRKMIQRVLQRYSIRLIVFDPDDEVIVSWQM